MLLRERRERARRAGSATGSIRYCRDDDDSDSWLAWYRFSLCLAAPSPFALPFVRARSLARLLVRSADANVAVVVVVAVAVAVDAASICH